MIEHIHTVISQHSHKVASYYDVHLTDQEGLEKKVMQIYVVDIRILLWLFDYVFNP